ncbi:MAG: hypothetical protein H7Y00_07250 [Fimbriimonadaceae bacterium]|nr:hypothetical protein [Chitinophagales bacterium]
MQFPSSEQFDTFYYDNLKPLLEKEDGTRKKIILNNTILAVVIVAGFIVETVTWMLIGIIFIVIFVFWFTRQYNISFNYYQLRLENIIFSRVAKFIFPAFQYDYDRYIKLKDLQQGFIVSGEPKQYGGKNFINCVAGTMHIEISEISSFTNQRDVSGTQSHHRHFSGLVGCAQFKISLKDPIMIVNESELQESLSFVLPEEKQSVTNETFFSNYYNEKDFQKYLSPSVWLLIKDYVDSTGNKIIITIKENGMYAGISKDTHQPYIPVQVFQSAVNKKPAETYFKDIIFLMQLFKAIEKIQLAEVK